MSGFIKRTCSEDKVAVFPLLVSEVCSGRWGCRGRAAKGVTNTQLYLRTPNPMNYIGFGCEFIGFGAMDVTKPCEFRGFGAMDVTKPAFWIFSCSPFPRGVRGSVRTVISYGNR